MTEQQRLWSDESLFDSLMESVESPPVVQGVRDDYDRPDQKRFVWEDPSLVPVPLTPFQGDWVHDEDCDCGICRYETDRLHWVRIAHYATRSEYERLKREREERLAYYEARVQAGLGLWDDEYDEFWNELEPQGVA